MSNPLDYQPPDRFADQVGAQRKSQPTILTAISVSAAMGCWFLSRLAAKGLFPYEKKMFVIGVVISLICTTVVIGIVIKRRAYLPFVYFSISVMSISLLLQSIWNVVQGIHN